MSDSKSKSFMDKAYWPMVIILIIIAVWIFFPSSPGQPGNAGTFAASTSEYGGVAITDACVNHDAGFSAHYHFDLFLYINGTEESVPANIGVSGECMRSIHTHDFSGHVHIELSEDYSGNTPTLGDFFNIWGYELNSTHLLDNQGSLQMELNDEMVDLGSNNPGHYRPADADVIVLSLFQ